MRFYELSLLLVLLPGSSVMAIAESTTVTDEPSTWKCNFCKFENGFNSVVQGGLGYVSEDSYKLGDYTGLQKKGVFVIFDATSRYRNNNANFLDFSAFDIGLESRSIELMAGKQGLYNVSLHYNELPHTVSNSAQTPFRGSGGGNLTLPADWVFGQTVDGMSKLNGSLESIDLKSKRVRLGTGVSFIPSPKWETSINYRREVREGKMRIAGSFYFNSVELVQPVDYTTDLVDAVASYNSKLWQMKLSYYGSNFRNQNDSLTWQNPYAPIISGATQGELALPPDNQFHQILASFGM
jgi:MtrB/PioB family decaheme-associated outer membrane protein